MKLLLLFSIICLLNKTHSLTDEEEISLNNLSWLYAQFSLTFDPNEINTSDDVSDVLTPSSKELRRRKRHHIEEINCSLPEPKNGFWCSPFYLRLNPMNYIYCKLSGHKNLHFFNNVFFIHY